MGGPAALVLSERVTRFGRLLRAAGLPLGPGRILGGIEALAAVDATRRDDFYWALHCAWVDRREDRELFREAFRLFWREPERPVNRVLEELLASARLTPERRAPQAHRRVLDALEDERIDRLAGRQAKPTDQVEVVRLAASDVEVLRHKDFEQMSAAELREAARMLAELRFPARDIRTRRWAAANRRSAIDLRRTMRSSLRRGRDHIPLHWRRRRMRPPELVAIADISGSMAAYTRMLLRFLHALSSDRDRVHTFLFGTRLTNATRTLRRRDPDAALADLGRQVRDWEGGTRIGACLAEFNRTWSRRVLARGAVVLLVTDGLDRGEPGSIAPEMARLRRSARSVVWLNPLLRYAEFRPEARGIREMLPHVDDFRPAHNVVSLEDLARALGGTTPTSRVRRSRSATPEQPS